MIEAIVIFAVIEFMQIICLLFITYKILQMGQNFTALKGVLEKIGADVDRIKTKLEQNAESGLTAEVTQELLNIANGIDAKVPEETEEGGGGQAEETANA